MQTTFPLFIPRILAREGGYTNHPADPGGPTNFGVTIADARHYAVELGWITDREVDVADVKAMPEAFAVKVFKLKYWDALRCDELPAGPDDAIGDYGINSGIGRAGIVLRRVLGLPANTSVVSDAVIAAAAKVDPRWLADAICDERLGFLHGLKTWPVFGTGWARRVAEVRAFDEKLATSGEGHVLIAGSFGGRAVDPDEHERTSALQRRLAEDGFDPGAIDGDLGPKTVRAFQLANHLDADGIVGPVTRPLLDEALVEAA